MLNFAGVQKASISFTDAEGAPEHLDINASYLSVVTVKGVIQIHDVKKPTRPQPIGSAGKFTALPLVTLDSVGVLTSTAAAVGGLGGGGGPGGKTSSISSTKLIMGILGKGALTASPSNASSLKVKEIKVNCKGNRVAILADHIEGALQVGTGQFCSSFCSYAA